MFVLSGLFKLLCLYASSEVIIVTSDSLNQLQCLLTIFCQLLYGGYIDKPIDRQPCAAMISWGRLCLRYRQDATGLIPMDRNRQ